jgi:hypothetical protein
LQLPEIEILMCYISKSCDHEKKMILMAKPPEKIAKKGKFDG